MKGKLVKLVAPLPYSIKRLLFRTWLALTSAGHVANKGERVVVGSWRELVNTHEFYHVMHAHRYDWASKQLQNAPFILDFGCGSGYGSWFLAHTLKESKVCGYDVDGKAVDWATKHFQKLSLYYTTSLPDVKFDGVTSFEVIEHIEDQQGYIDSLKEKLEPNGVLLISTANGSRISVRQKLIDNNLVTVNHTHVHELTPADFCELLERNFKSVELYGQCVRGVYSFDDWNRWRRVNTVEIKDFEMRDSDYDNCEVIVAVCKR